jgi:glycosyltransferase involved in cell wall biosynthesis
VTSKISNHRKSILVITSTFPRWKGDHEPPFVFELSRRLAREFDVSVLAPHAPESRTDETLDGMHIHRFRYFFGKWEALAYQGGIMAKLKQHVGYYALIPFFLTAQLIALLRLLKRKDIDVIHAHWLIPQGLTGVICRWVCGTRAPALLCTTHGTDLLGLRHPLFTKAKQLVFKHAMAVTAVSNTLKQEALELGLAQEKISVIPMGIDAINTFTRGAFNDRRAAELLFVGRLVKSKAVDVLLRTLPSILAAYPDTNLLIAGDGPERQHLHSLAKDLGILGRVQFLGPVPNHDLPALYQRATIFVSPSLSEGFGLTVAEALACECAVIASDLPAMRDIFTDGISGLTTTPGNADDLTSKILRLLSNPVLREELGCAGRKAVLQRYDWEIISRQYSALLHHL